MAEDGFALRYAVPKLNEWGGFFHLLEKAFRIAEGLLYFCFRFVEVVYMDSGPSCESTYDYTDNGLG